MEKGESVDTAYLDFQKAFYKVCRQKLLSKVSRHRMRRKVLNWLKDRKQRLGINGQFSEWKEITSGVLQWSVLNSVLCNMFINYLEKGISSEVAKLTDDKNYSR